MSPNTIFEDPPYLKAHRKLMRRWNLLSYTSLFAGIVACFLFAGIIDSKSLPSTAVLILGGAAASIVGLRYRRLSADVEKHVRNLMFRAFNIATRRIYEKSSKVSE